MYCNVTPAVYKWVHVDTDMDMEAFSDMSQVALGSRIKLVFLERAVILLSA